MFEFLLSIRVSFWLVRVGRMLRRCAATLPRFWEKTSLCSASFLGGSVEEGLEAIDKFLGSLESKVSLEQYPNRLVWAHHQYKMWHRPLLCALSPSLQWYSHSLGALGASKLETGWMAPVIGGSMLQPLESRPS